MNEQRELTLGEIEAAMGAKVKSLKLVKKEIYKK